VVGGTRSQGSWAELVQLLPRAEHMESYLAVPSLSFIIRYLLLQNSVLLISRKPSLTLNLSCYFYVPVFLCVSYHIVTSSSLITPSLDCVLLEGRDCVLCCFHCFSRELARMDGCMDGWMVS